MAILNLLNIHEWISIATAINIKIYAKWIKIYVCIYIYVLVFLTLVVLRDFCFSEKQFALIWQHQSNKIENVSVQSISSMEQIACM